MHPHRQKTTIFAPELLRIAFRITVAAFVEPSAHDVDTVLVEGDVALKVLGFVRGLIMEIIFRLLD